VLLNITSGSALRGQAGVSLYCGAKAGLENFIRAVALEQAAESAPFIAVNVDPGAMDTEMQDSLVQANKVDFPEVERFVQRKTNGTLRAPARVASATARIAELPDLTGGHRYDVGDYGV
jgi:benzil reductase ((S)-benzoin forming)